MIYLLCEFDMNILEKIFRKLLQFSIECGIIRTWKETTKNTETKGNKTMKTPRIILTTVTKRVLILGEYFALVTFDVNGERKYGTVPYKYIDERGKTTKRLNLLELHSQNTVAETIKQTEISIIFRRWCKEHPQATEIEKVYKVVELQNTNYAE